MWGLPRRMSVRLVLLYRCFRCLGAEIDEVKELLTGWHVCARLAIHVPLEEGRLVQFQLEGGRHKWTRWLISHQLQQSEVLLYCMCSRRSSLLLPSLRLGVLRMTLT